MVASANQPNRLPSPKFIPNSKQQQANSASFPRAHTVVLSTKDASTIPAMDSTTMDTEPSEPQVLFRPGKKRKIYRHRTDGAEGQGDLNGSAGETSEAGADTKAKISDDDEDTSAAGTALSVAEALRLRNARRRRLGGVEFRREDVPRTDFLGENSETSLALRDGEVDTNPGAEAAMSISTRFAPETGLIGELVNKHM